VTRSYALSREDIALSAVEAYEKKKGRKPHRSSQGSGYDMESSGRKIEIKTRSSLKGGFVQLGERQFRVLCKERKYWIYVVCISGRKTQIFEFPRSVVLPRIRPYIHYDFIFGKKDLK
jgi:uncharacterized protein DUF3883